MLPQLQVHSLGCFRRPKGCAPIKRATQQQTRACASNGSNGSTSNGSTSNGATSNGNGASPTRLEADKNDRRFVKWAKMSLSELGQLSLTEELEAARAQQEFSRDPNRVPKVQNKASLLQHHYLACT